MEYTDREKLEGDYHMMGCESPSKSDNHSAHSPQKVFSTGNFHECDSGKPFIGTIEQAPHYHQCYNEHLKRGYRINYKTWGSLLRSLFQCHNETVNVWTHFIGFWATLSMFFHVLGDYHSAFGEYS